MTDPWAARGVSRMMPGTVGGRSRIATPVTRLERQRRIRRPVPTGFLTVTFLPTTGGAGEVVYEATGASCPSFLVDANDAVFAFNENDSGPFFALGVCKIAGTVYVPVWGADGDTGDPVVWWIDYTTTNVVAKSFTVAAADATSSAPGPVFDGAGNIYFARYDEDDHHWLSRCDFPGIGTDYGAATDLVDFGEDTSGTPGTGIGFLSMGFNPYDGWIYYKDNRATVTGGETAFGRSPNLFRWREGDGEEDLGYEQGAGDNMCFTPDGAVWMTKHHQFASGVVGTPPPDPGVWRFDGSFTGVDVTGIDTSGTPVPLSDNSVLVNTDPGDVEKNVDASLTVTASGCDLQGGTAKVATGAI